MMDSIFTKEYDYNFVHKVYISAAESSIKEITIGEKN